MAYELAIDKTYPEGERYTGVAERFEAYLSGPPEQITFDFYDDIIAKVIEFFPPEGADKLIRIRIWQDTEPFWTTLYKIEVIGHSSPIHWTPIILAIAAVLVVWGIAVISWNVTHMDWKAATPALIGVGVGLALLALAVILGMPKRRER